MTELCCSGTSFTYLSNVCSAIFEKRPAKQPLFASKNGNVFSIAFYCAFIRNKRAFDWCRNKNSCPFAVSFARFRPLALYLRCIDAVRNRERELEKKFVQQSDESIHFCCFNNLTTIRIDESHLITNRTEWTSTRNQNTHTHTHTPHHSTSFDQYDIYCMNREHIHPDDCLQPSVCVMWLWSGFDSQPVQSGNHFDPTSECLTAQSMWGYGRLYTRVIQPELYYYHHWAPVSAEIKCYLFPVIF